MAQKEKQKLIDKINSSVLPKELREKLLQATERCPDTQLKFIGKALATHQKQQNKAFKKAVKKDPDGALTKLKAVDNKSRAQLQEHTEKREAEAAEELLKQDLHGLR